MQIEQENMSSHHNDHTAIDEQTQTHNNITHQLPATYRLLPSSHFTSQLTNVFAEATLADVYGKSNLQSALHYEAKTFASSYFENMGKGQFNRTILPVEAQVSNVDDIMINDFDRDGNQDILIIGNMYPVEVETTRNDAGVGLFLKGNAKGEFTPISSYESGFFSNGDGKKMSLINIKGVNHIVVAINNGSIEGFRINKE